jgi:transposase InsO family protein
LWLSNITEHRNREGKLNPCAMKDVFSNRIVGYSIDSRMKPQLAVAALTSAVARRGEVAGCVYPATAAGSTTRQTEPAAYGSADHRLTWAGRVCAIGFIAAGLTHDGRSSRTLVPTTGRDSPRASEAAPDETQLPLASMP